MIDFASHRTTAMKFVFPLNTLQNICRKLLAIVFLFYKVDDPVNFSDDCALGDYSTCNKLSRVYLWPPFSNVKSQ